MTNIREIFYLAFPALGNIAATIKGIQLNRLRYGEHYGKIVDDILDRKGWSSDQFTAYQINQLRKIIGTAVCHTPYYRELFATLGRSGLIRYVWCPTSCAPSTLRIPVLVLQLCR